MENKEEALDWALTYLRAVVGSEIEDNIEYKTAVNILESEGK